MPALKLLEPEYPFFFPHISLLLTIPLFNYPGSSEIYHAVSLYETYFIAKIYFASKYFEDYDKFIKFAILLEIAQNSNF